MITICQISQLAKVNFFYLNREVKMLYGEEEFQSLYVPGDNHPTLKGNKALDSHRILNWLTLVISHWIKQQ